MPIAHVSLPVADLEASLAFYLDVLKPLGYEIFHKLEETAGLGLKNGDPDFWLFRCPEAAESKTIAKTHVAFQGSSQEEVAAFHAAALYAAPSSFSSALLFLIRTSGADLNCFAVGTRVPKTMASQARDHTMRRVTMRLLCLILMEIMSNAFTISQSNHLLCRWRRVGRFVVSGLG